MKHFLLAIFSLLVFSFAGKAQDYEIITDSLHPNEKILKGIISKSDLENDPAFSKWYTESQKMYPVLNEDAVKKCQPDFTLMKKTGEKIIITAPGKVSDTSRVSDTYDFVSRFFAPTAGVDEDPVTGSAHSQLIPFWSYKLGKEKMKAKQLSKRGGDIYCEQKGERVIMGGQAVFYMKGEIEV